MNKDTVHGQNAKYDHRDFAQAEDMRTGRPCKDAQMHALKKVHGVPVRQATLPPYISELPMTEEKD